MQIPEKIRAKARTDPSHKYQLVAPVEADAGVIRYSATLGNNAQNLLKRALYKKKFMNLLKTTV